MNGIFRGLIGVLAVCLVGAGLGQASQSPTASAFKVEKLPAGYVRGDVVSYSYVPNRCWGRAEAIGKLPYLFEYGLMAQKDGTPLESFHAENIRRIDMASQWSTAIMLYPRHIEYRDEIINLMIRCFHNRELIVLSDYLEPGQKAPLSRLTAILDKLWASRDTQLISPEGDKATGRQLINNILLVCLGDEEFSKLRTAGLESIGRTFDRLIKDRLIDGRRPFSHIKCWYNDVHCGFGAYAIDQADVEAGKAVLPSNFDFFGVDTYHWWGFDTSPFDPDDPNIPRRRVVDHCIYWQSVITKYYGPDFRVTRGDPWTAEHKNDTHALLQGLDLAGADHTMMLFIGTSCYLPEHTYTTPVEVMDAYYDSCKAGPWVGLSWWVFDGFHSVGTLDYMDKKLVHYTPKNPKGSPYTDEQLEAYRRKFIASRMRMFRDVVYGQFGYLNGPAPGQ